MRRSGNRRQGGEERQELVGGTARTRQKGTGKMRIITRHRKENPSDCLIKGNPSVRCVFIPHSLLSTVRLQIENVI
jgi:hypothetical protein